MFLFWSITVIWIIPFLLGFCLYLLRSQSSRTFCWNVVFSYTFGHWCLAVFANPVISNTASNILARTLFIFLSSFEIDPCILSWVWWATMHDIMLENHSLNFQNSYCLPLKILLLEFFIMIPNIVVPSKLIISATEEMVGSGILHFPDQVSFPILGGKFPKKIAF